MAEEAVAFVAGLDGLLREIGEENGVANAKIENVSGWQKGDGYMSFITLSKIADQDEKNVLNVVVKTSSRSDASRNLMPVVHYFEAEIYFYEQIAAAFTQFLAGKKLPSALPIPKCYRTSLADKAEFLVLENMKAKNYKSWTRKLPMDDDHLCLVLREYGRLHAMSFGMKDQQAERFKDLVAKTRDTLHDFVVQADMTQSVDNFLSKAQKSLDPVRHAKELKQFKEFRSGMGDFLERLPEYVDEFSVICHGDAWTNNMLFEYKDPRSATKPTKVCLIDFQGARLASPVFDVSYFLYACASKSAIDNLDYFRDVYYKSLTEHLEKMGSDVDKLFPLAVFRRHWEKYARFAVATATALIFAMLSDPEESIDLNGAVDAGASFAEAFDYEIANMDEYLDRVGHIILHCCRNGFI